MRIFDCFSGIGGFRSAAKMAFKGAAHFVGHCEIDKYANRTYAAMHCVDGKSEIAITDLTTITRDSTGKLCTPKQVRSLLPAQILAPDLFCAGFPCQPHSLMGNREGSKDARGALVDDMLVFIEAILPKYIILENVRAVKSVNSGMFFSGLIDRLKKSYHMNFIEANAANFGVPQVRRRLFIAGSIERNPVLQPKEIDISKASYPSTWHLLEECVDEKFYLSEKIKKTILADEHKGYFRKAEINRILARPLTRTMHKMHRASQDNYYSDSYIHGDFDESSRVVHELRKGRSRIRRITPREALRIQSFSDDEIERALASGVSDTQLYMQAGNAVPALLAKAILETIT